MLTVLDTNHFRELTITDDSAIGRKLERRLISRSAQVHLCIVVVEETIQGFLAMLHRLEAGRDQVPAYIRLQRGLTALGMIPSLPFDSASAEVFHELRRDRIRIGTMDLKIAAICIAHDAVLLSRNLADFGKIPKLQVENWLD